MPIAERTAGVKIHTTDECMTAAPRSGFMYVSEIIGNAFDDGRMRLTAVTRKNRAHRTILSAPVEDMDRLALEWCRARGLKP